MYSEAYQDKFVDIALGNQAHGFFVDVGAGCDDPKHGSNTLMFEERGWEGVAIDADSSRMAGRSCKCISCMIGDGSNETSLLGKLLKEETSTPDLVDYLSIDLEGQDFNAVKSFCEEGYRFKVATIEHNLYSRNPGVDELKRDIFLFLAQAGYVRVVDNVGNRADAEDLHRGWAFEDWYIDPKQVNYMELMAALYERRKS